MSFTKHNLGAAAGFYQAEASGLRWLDEATDGVSVPVAAQIGATGWTTSLFPKDGRYIVPVKAWVRKAEGLELGDLVTIRLAVDV